MEILIEFLIEFVFEVIFELIGLGIRKVNKLIMYKNRRYHRLT